MRMRLRNFDLRLVAVALVAVAMMAVLMIGRAATTNSPGIRPVGYSPSTNPPRPQPWSAIPANYSYPIVDTNGNVLWPPVLRAQRLAGDGSMMGPGPATSLESTNYARYLAALASKGQKVSVKARQRLAAAFTELESSDLWTNLVDGAVLGTNCNTAGSTWVSLRASTIYASNAPTCFDYGATFSTNQIGLMVVPDARTNTIVVTFSKGNDSQSQIVGLQDRVTIDHTVGLWNDTTAMIAAYVRNAFPDQYKLITVPTTWGEGYMSCVNQEEHTLALSSAGSGVYQFGFDGDSSPLSTNAGFAMTFPLTNFVIGGSLNGTNIYKSFNGIIHSAFLFNRVLTTDEIRTVMRAARWFDFREDNCIFVGDSMSTPLQDARLNENWPYQLMNGKANTNRFYYRNVARNGAITFDASDYARVVKQFRPGGPVRNSKLYFRFGPNDIALGASADTLWTRFTNFWNLARADGFSIEVLNLTPAVNYNYGGTLEFTTAHDQVRRDINARLATNHLAFDRLWRVDSLIPDMQTNQSPFSYDGLHQNGAGYKAIAEMIASGENTAATVSRTFHCQDITSYQGTAISSAPIGEPNSFFSDPADQPILRWWAPNWASFVSAELLFYWAGTGANATSFQTNRFNALYFDNGNLTVGSPITCTWLFTNGYNRITYTHSLSESNSTVKALQWDRLNAATNAAGRLWLLGASCSFGGTPGGMETP